MNWIKSLSNHLLGFFSAITELYGNRFSYLFHEVIYKADEYYVAYSVRGNRKIFHRKFIDVLSNDEEIKKYSPTCVKQMLLCYSNLSDTPLVTDVDQRATCSIKRANVTTNTCLIPLCCIYVAFLITAIYLSPNIINLGDFIEPRGILIFPATYIIADIISEVYRIKYVMRLIYTTMFILVMLAIAIWFSMQLTPVVNGSQTAAYHQVFDNIPKLLFANIIAILLSDFINAKLFDKIRKITNSQYLWLRVLGASTVAELIFTYTWVFMFFYFMGGGSTQSIWQLAVFALNNFAFKMFYGVFSIPITYLVVPLVKRVDTYFDTPRKLRLSTQ